MRKIGPILPPLVGLTIDYIDYGVYIIYGLTAGRAGGRQAGRRTPDMGGFRNFKTLQVKLFGILFTAVLELHSVGFCQVKVYFKVCFEVRKIR